MSVIPGIIRIGTRRSPLALWQASFVAAQLRALPQIDDVELVPIETSGDQVTGPLWQAGGKGLFVKELDQALLAGDIDLAVHSTKDIPGELVPGITLVAFPPRADPFDVMITAAPLTLLQLPMDARVGTSSPRRMWQLRAVRPDLQIVPLRGNVATRVHKLQMGEYDAIVLAAAGVERLQLPVPHAERLPLEQMLPAVGQGALAIAVRNDDLATMQLVRAHCNDDATEMCVTAERALLTAIAGDCHTPLAGYATCDGARLRLRAFFCAPDGTKMMRRELIGSITAPADLGKQMAAQLRNEL